MLTRWPRDGDPLYSSKESLHSFDSERFLTYSERFWRRRQPWLEFNGYMLRPKFRPGWIPSWTTSGTKKRKAEDAIAHRSPIIVDATRISDGRSVYVKQVNIAESGRGELDISLFFSEEPRKSDPRNHCVPVLDVLHRPEVEEAYLIVPALRPFNSPPFVTIGEAVDFFHQIFEGLLFIQENHVVHRDCGDLNVMMDGSQMYPQSFHPTKIDQASDLKGRAPHLPRTDCKPRYYLIDFGLSKHYDPTRKQWPPLELKVRGVDKSAPEHQDLDGLHNPFPTDVYHIGNLIRENFLQHFKGLSFMEPLISGMIQDNPDLRPPMLEVISAFNDICRKLSHLKLRSRLAKCNEFAVVKCWRICAHFVRTLRYEVKSVPPVSVPAVHRSR